jgi:hypothetical protein
VAGTAEADAAQRLLSEVKVWLALLPDDASLELRAPKSDATDPAMRLGVRPRLPVPKPNAGAERLPQSPWEGRRRVFAGVGSPPA